MIYGYKLWEAINTNGVSVDPVIIFFVADGLYTEYRKSVGFSLTLTECSNNFTEDVNCMFTLVPLTIHIPPLVISPETPVSGLITAIPLS